MANPAEKLCNICVIGSINMDLVVRSPRFAKSGETLTAHSWDRVPGGKGANQAVALARLGARTTFCGCIGNDVFGELLRANLVRENANVANLIVNSEVGSGVAMIIVDDAGRNSIYVVGGANHTLRDSDIRKLAPVIQASHFVLLQLEIPCEANLEVIKIARENGVQVLLDPAPVPADRFPEALLQVDLLSPNATEAEMLTGIAVRDAANAKEAAKSLAARGCQRVVIKLGERGALALEKNGQAWHIPAAPVDVIDTTAAGDAFSAALAFSLAHGKDLVAATQVACAAGAVAVGRAGAQPSMPTLREVEVLLSKYEFCPRLL